MRCCTIFFHVYYYVAYDAKIDGPIRDVYYTYTRDGRQTAERDDAARIHIYNIYYNTRCYTVYDGVQLQLLSAARMLHAATTIV